MGYFYIFITIILTAYGQVILKWRLNQFDGLPEGLWTKLLFLVKAVFDPYIFSSFFAAFLASLAWMAALKEFELSKAYPFMSLSFVCVLFLSYFFLKETVSTQKIIGTAFIVIGIIIISKAS
jgi:uncharacterized membrane protein